MFFLARQLVPVFKHAMCQDYWHEVLCHATLSYAMLRKLHRARMVEWQVIASAEKLFARLIVNIAKQANAITKAHLNKANNNLN